MRSLSRPLVLGLAGLLMAAACGTGGASPSADASTAPTDAAPTDAATTAPSAAPSAEAPSGTLTIYAGRSEELVGPLIERFQTETGVTVEVNYAGTTDLAATILEEGDASPADVFFAQDAGALGAVAADGRLAALPAGHARPGRRPLPLRRRPVGRHLRPRPGRDLRLARPRCRRHAHQHRCLHRSGLEGHDRLGPDQRLVPVVRDRLSRAQGRRRGEGLAGGHRGQRAQGLRGQRRGPGGGRRRRDRGRLRQPLLPAGGHRRAGRELPGPQPLPRRRRPGLAHQRGRRRASFGRPRTRSPPRPSSTSCSRPRASSTSRPRPTSSRSSPASRPIRRCPRSTRSPARTSTCPTCPTSRRPSSSSRKPASSRRPAGAT